MLPAGRTVHGPRGMVCSVDHLASSAGVSILREGGSAADAAVATSAVLAVTTQHMCGMGGDLFALVHDATAPAPRALAAVGRAGSGADAAAMRAEGLTAMPPLGDVRTATVPGCVDGWLALHERFGRLPLAEVLEPAIGYARDGFPASPLLAASVPSIAALAGADDYRIEGLRPGGRVRRPLVAQVLEAIVTGGREAFYEGSFGAGLQQLGEGLFTPDDLARSLADWVEPLRVTAWDHDVWTVPPPSQGYLTLASAWIADGLELPDDTEGPAWVHLLAEAARVAGHDRLDVLYDGANGGELLAPERLAPRRASIDPGRRGMPSADTRGGGTIYLCAVDSDAMGVSLIQSNAAGWGCHLVVPGTGIFLHNRGIGFSLDPGHPAELAPDRRPPHTLSPAVVTAGGALRSVLGTMGGDIQPQVVLQLLARILRNGQSPGTAVRAPRWMLGSGGFDTWAGGGPQSMAIEADAPEAWVDGLVERGHHVVRAGRWTNFGHAHAIVVGADGMLSGASDPRALSGAAIAW
ncbi:MAG: gamma-glutamyltransferase family protein [Actinomycetota bacterium]